MPVQATHTGTEAPHGAGFPPFKTETFPSQIFWLEITFAFLFVVLWRVAGPRIGGVIGARKGRIADDLSTAGKHRSDAEGALAGYTSALTTARAKAHAVADENRKLVDAEVEKAKADPPEMNLVTNAFCSAESVDICTPLTLARLVRGLTIGKFDDFVLPVT